MHSGSGKKLLGWLLSLVMVMTLFPATVFADGTEDGADTQTFNVTLHAVYDKAEFVYEDESGEEQGSATRVIPFEAGSIINAEDTYGLTWNTAEGWEFLGWSEDPDSTVADYAGGEIGRDTELYAVWDDGLVTVTYDANGGYFNADDPSETIRTMKSLKEDYFQRVSDVYNDDPLNRFIGWFDAPEGGREYIPYETEINDDVTVYAHWEKRVSQELILGDVQEVNSEGGMVFLTFTPEEDGLYDLFLTDDYAYGDITLYYYGEQIIDWSKSSNYRLEENLISGRTYYFGIKSDNDEGASFHCQVRMNKPETVKVTFHTEEEGTWIGEEGQSSAGMEAAVGSYIFFDEFDNIRPGTDRKDIVFKGWALADDRDELYSPIYVDDTDLDFYAVWTPAYAITYHSNGEGTSLIYEFDEKEGEYVPRTDYEMIVPAGKSVADYYKEIIGHPENTDQNVSFAGWAESADAELPDHSLVADSVKDVYAVWTEPCNVTLVLQPGIAYFEVYDDDENVQKTTFKTIKMAKGSRLTRDITELEWIDQNYTFLGWSKVINAEKADDFITVTGDMAVYGIFDDGYVDVTFDANGGYLDEYDHSVTTRLRRVYSGEELPGIGTPYHDNPLAIFKGWFDKKEGGNQYYPDETTIHEDITLYAHWEIAEPRPLAIGEEQTVSSDGEDVFFSFTPETDGFYMLEGNLISGTYPEYIINLYEDGFEGERTTYYFCDDDSWDKTLELSAGKDYFIGIGCERKLPFTLSIRLVVPKMVTVTYHTSGEGTYLDEEGQQSVEKACVANDYPRPYSYAAKTNREDITFIGWSLTEGSDKIFHGKLSDKDTDLYAVWKKVYPVTFVSGDAENTYLYEEWNGYEERYIRFTEKTIRVMEGSHVEQSDYDFDTYIHHDDPNVAFVGWSEDPNASEPDKDLIVNRPMTLYAVFVQKYEVTFDLNTTTDIAYYEQYDEYDELIKAGTKTLKKVKGYKIRKYDADDFGCDDNYDFLGWSTDPDARRPEKSIIVNGNMTLYGVWERARVALKLHSNGGYFNDEGDITDTVKSSSDYNSLFDGETPVYHDNPFAWLLGWYDAPEGGNRIDKSVILTDDAELYAHWLIREPEDIGADTGTQVRSDGEEKLYEFTPDETALYKIYSYDRENRNVYYGPRVCLYDSNMELIESDQGGRGDVNFMLVRELEKGSKYYVGVNFVDNEQSGINDPFAYSIIINKADQVKLTLHLNVDTDRAYFEDDEEKKSDIQQEIVKGTLLRDYQIADPEIVDPSLILTGWTRNPESGKADFSSHLVGEDMDLYAVWSEGYPVTFDLNNENVYWYSYEYYQDEDDYRLVQSYDPKTKTLGEGYEIKHFYSSYSGVPEDVYFAGWSEDPNAAEPDEDLVVTKEMTVYAVWKHKQKVTVHINTESARFVDENDNYLSEVSVYYRPEDIVDVRYLPGRWGIEYYDDNSFLIGGSAESSTGKPEKYLTLEQGMTDIWMIWEEGAEVTYNINKAKNPDAYFLYLDRMEGMWVESDEYKKEVIGSNVISAGSGVARNESKTLGLAGWSTDPNAEEPDNDIAVSAGLKLYAVWKPYRNLTLVANNDNAYFREYDIETDRAEYSSEYTMQIAEGETFDINDYAFMPLETDPSIVFYGWAADKNTAPDGELLGSITMEKDITVYAVWKQGTQITLHTNHPEACWDDQEGINETTDTMVLYDFDGVFEGGVVPYQNNIHLDFAGWAYSANASAPDEINGVISINGPTDLYGVWKRNDLIPIDDGNITAEIAEEQFTYTGNPITPKVIVKDDGAELEEDVDYTVEYANNINAGKAEVTITGIGKYTGNRSIEFTIGRATSKITLKPLTKTYTGSTINIGKAVVTGSTGKVTYAYYSDSKCTKKVSAHKNAGTYYVKATVATDANYKGKVSAAVKLVINKAASTIKLTKKSAVYTGKSITAVEKTVKKTGSTGKVTFTYYKDKACKNKVTKHINAGTYYVKATVAADTNHKAATSSAVTLTITKAAQPMKVTGLAPVLAAANVRKGTQIIAASKAYKYTAKAQGTLKYKKTKGNSKITVNPTTGKITVPKGLKANKYTIYIMVTAAGNTNYKAGSKNIKVTVEIK